jgi:hypothetical protein
MSIPLRIIANGLTRSFPAYFGALPCVGSKSAHEPSGQIGEDVPVEVRQHEDVVVLRVLDQLHAHVVHDPVVEAELGKLRRHAARELEE